MTSDQPTNSDTPVPVPPTPTSKAPAIPPITSPALTGLLAEAITAIDGVVRLQPTLSTDGPRILVRDAATDGLHLLMRAGVVDVDVNVITDATREARGLAHQISRCATDLIHTHQLTAGPITVNVLAVEAVAATTHP